MPTPCSIDLLKNPLETSFEYLEETSLDVFFALGIVDPFGPTLTVVGTVGNGKAGQVLPLFVATLNPFAVETKQIGRFNIGDIWNPLTLLAPLIAKPFGACPTLVLLNRAFDDATRNQICHSLLRASSDGLQHTLTAVSGHIGDPWRRVPAQLDAPKAEFDNLSIDELANRLSMLLLSPTHIEPEIQAFLYSWNGSIEFANQEVTASPVALGYERMKEFMFKRILPAVYLPPSKTEAPDDTDPADDATRFEPESTEQVRDILRSESWRAFSKPKLADYLKASIFIYGLEINETDIGYISRLYECTLTSGVDVNVRVETESQVTVWVEQGTLSAVAFLPFVVMDPHYEVASKATIDFVSCSPFSGNELYALAELRSLLSRNQLANRAVVFGAILAMGDPVLRQFAIEHRSYLTPDEIRRAAQIHTAFPQHQSLQFWLNWAMELQDERGDDDLSLFGSCAAALIASRRHERVSIVSDSARNFPCAGSANPITVHRNWTINEYADLLAPSLYQLEAREEAPKVFSHVLRIWGLQPHAPLDEQFIPDQSQSETTFTRLRDPFPAPTACPDGIYVCVR